MKAHPCALRRSQESGCRHRFLNARVLIVTTSPTRRDWLLETIEQIGAGNGLGPEILARFWIATRVELTEVGATAKIWHIPTPEEELSLL